MIGEAARLASLFLFPSRNRAGEVYELLSTGNTLGEASLFLNLGYWPPDRSMSYDEAAEELARELAREARMGPQDEVLDCGFGFGDQDFLWAREFRPKRIVGLNVAVSQVELARRRAAELGLGATVDLRLGSATAMPVERGSFDKVTALETAFHYDTREDFFREAFRALRPGGVLATADILPKSGAPRAEGPWTRGLAALAGDWLARGFWQIPKANQYPLQVYEEKLRAAGFVEVRGRSIADRVLAPFARRGLERLDDPAVKGRMNPLIRSFWKASCRALLDGGAFDYVMVSAKKPGAAG